MRDALKILQDLEIDLKRLHETEEKIYNRSYQTIPLAFRTLLSSLLSGPATQIRNMTLGQYLAIIQYRKFARLGATAATWMVTKNLYKLGVNAVFEMLPPVSRKRDAFGAYIRTNPGKNWFTRLVKSFSYRALDAGFGQRREELQRLGMYTKEPLWESVVQNWYEVSEVEPRLDDRIRS